MKRVILLVVILAIAALGVGASAAPQEQGPQQQITSLKKQLRSARLDLADARDQIDAQDALIGDQSDTIARLRGRLANPPDPVDVITAREPADLWAAAQAIWRAFPTLPVGSLCGFDKATTQTADLTPDSFTFYRWTAC